jgi:hypothetical protein
MEVPLNRITSPPGLSDSTLTPIPESSTAALELEKVATGNPFRF